MTMAKWKTRDALMSLESIRRGTGMLISNNNTLLVNWCRQYPQHEHHVFPFGRNLFETRRTVPRTREMTLEDGTEKKQPTGPPTEILVPSPNASPASKKCTVKASLPPLVPQTTAKTNNDDDNDSGITLDDLQCCVCQVGDATDENDVLLCDGQGCYRAFHMKCIHPEVTPKDIEDEDEDWFCPMCSTISNFIMEVQIVCMGEEWEHRRRASAANIKNDDSSSLRSWAGVDEVFPTAEWEYEAAMKLKRGRQNDDTRELLAIYLGEDFQQGEPPSSMPIGSDSEDEEDYSLFDENSFKERRHKERGGEEIIRDDSSKSTHSSQATLVDMEDVELKIGNDELAALSAEDDGDESSSSVDDDDGSDNGRARRSRRLLSKTQQSEQSSFADNVADFSEANILEGPRRRKRVDYCRLNDAMFGGLTAQEKAQIDDTDDFKLEKKRQRAPSPEGSDEDEERPLKRSRNDKADSDSDRSSDSGSSSEDDDDSGPGEEDAGDSNCSENDEEEDTNSKKSNGRIEKKRRKDVALERA
jgi:hypothetical protein